MLQAGRDSEPHEVEVQLNAPTIDAIARRVVALLGERPRADTATFLTADQVADQFGFSRAWVYENANRLGAVRIGEGKRPRLRFDADEVARRMSSEVRTPARTEEAGERVLGRSDLVLPASMWLAER